ncbi:flagellar hook protein FlgE [Paracandidimonas soli]|uniref:Flagellar hook protein FlgE n=1 Tax=Paracandidimonas soli TaxID=1917182 RepID=A0A4R3V6U3_9BURK|nr:flagellar hook protein FlgE [Paracandidimonas soli]TCV00807.1 flagellar hook protein FlgE [Paracandidimonas soli]
MGFGQGLSGLNAAAQDLDIIGNNIANSGTVGFKSSSASFADVYASSRVGLGTQVSRVNQRFTIGTVAGTGNQFDMAIDGQKGLFRLVDASGAVLYSRNGEFFPNKDLQLVNAQGHRLTGYAMNADGTPGNTLIPINVPVGNIDPVATSNIKFQTNLDADAKPIDGATIPFSSSDPASFTQSYPLDIYDSLGNKHVLTQYFVKRDAIGSESVWDVYYESSTLDGLPDYTDPATVPQQLRFSDAGVLTTPTATVGISATVQTAGSGSPAAALDIAMNYAGSTQFGSPFAPNFTVDGYASGEYASMSIGVDGAIQANYTNGATKKVGYIALADFNNLQGLQPVGGNAWIETAASGQPILGTPGTNGLAQLKGQAVEQSNVDMSQELVKMIIAQRTYQANAQTIKTQDQILQTLITMR